MKITLTLMVCALLSLFVAALQPRHQVPPSSAMASDALADAMSSHGIETGQPLLAGDGGDSLVRPVAYTPR